ALLSPRLSSLTSFSVQSSAASRDLHSFPTRRSSDLGSANGTFVNGRRLEPGEQVRLNPGDKVTAGSVEIPWSDGKYYNRPSQGRSEEHTSELQSRGHLVCRLLLEKKKTQKQTQT